MMVIVEGPKIAALSCGKPAYVVVLLHGPGSNGDAIIGQALNWAPTMPKADFVAAEAPFPCPQGGRQWFDTTEDFNAGNLSPAAINEGLRTVAPLLDSFLDEMLAQRRLPDSHLALVGFSQGAMLALHVGLRRQRQMAAIVSFSGALYDDALADDIRTRPAVLMIHGEADPVVTFGAMTATKERLKAQGVPVKSMRRPGLGHHMDDDGVIAAGDFLSAVVVHKPPASADAHDHHDHH
jgi:phospholipase/carboxylesterase